MNRQIYSGRFMIIIMVLWASAVDIHAQDEKLKAIFVYNFTKYINWPTVEGSFIITVLGSSSIITELKSISTKKMVGNSIIEIKNTANVTEVSRCQILYITAAKTSSLSQLLNLAAANNILIITEKPDACESGSGINFINTAGKVGFEISRKNLEKSGLSVSTDLLRLGTVVQN